MYSENGDSSYNNLLELYGAVVYIREALSTGSDFCLTGQALYCSEPQIEISNDKGIVLNYDNSQTSFTVNNIFILNQNFQCGYRECTLYEKGCLTPNSVNSKITNMNT